MQFVFNIDKRHRKQLFLLLGLCGLWLSPIQAQDEEPFIDDFVYADEEPVPENLGEVRQMIGYPEMAIQQNVQGNIVVRVLVDQEGSYVRHSVISAAHPILAQAVEDHIATLRFSPAKVEGKAIKFWVNIPFNFRLVDEQVEALKAALDSLNQLVEACLLYTSPSPRDS